MAPHLFMDCVGSLWFQDASRHGTDEDLADAFVGMVRVDGAQCLQGVDVISCNHKLPMDGQC